MGHDRPKSGDAGPADDDLPLLYPEDDEPSSVAPNEDLFDPFPDDPAPRAPGTRDTGASTPAKRGGKKLSDLLDFGPAESEAESPSQTPQRAPKKRTARPADMPVAPRAEQPSVFEPASGTAGPPPVPPALPATERPRRPRRSQPPQSSAAEASVFEPRRAPSAPKPNEGRSPAGAPPESSRDLPRVKPRYDRGREIGPIAATTAILVVLGLLATALGPLVGSGILLLGILWGVYRLCIILPHPVRVTPEQGVREFYEAFCHAVPNYRRMYLLLSVPAREAEEIGDSYRAFRAYWHWRHMQLLGTRSILKGLAFDIHRFEATYNSRRTYANVTYTLIFYWRGRPKDRLLVRPVASSMVKGPDGSWYMNEGTLG